MDARLGCRDQLVTDGEQTKTRARVPAPHKLEGLVGNIRPTRLDIQVLYIQRVLFDELAAGFDVFAHQRGEDGFAGGNVL
jgi:hypothetical protein